MKKSTYKVIAEEQERENGGQDRESFSQMQKCGQSQDRPQRQAVRTYRLDMECLRGMALRGTPKFWTALEEDEEFCWDTLSQNQPLIVQNHMSTGQLNGVNTAS